MTAKKWMVISNVIFGLFLLTLLIQWYHKPELYDGVLSEDKVALAYKAKLAQAILVLPMLISMVCYFVVNIREKRG